MNSHLLVTLLVLVLVGYIGFWFVDKTGAPQPINWIAKAIIALLCVGALFKVSGI